MTSHRIGSGQRLTGWSFTRLAVALVAIGLGGLVAGCGDDSDDDSGSSSGGETDVAAAATDELEKYYEGTYTEPPATAPEAEPGKSVWIISYGQATSLAADAVGGASDAAEMLGWSPTVFDGKLDPTQWANGVRQAVAANADGIILYLIDCNLVKGPLQQAKAAGIPVVGLESLDCNDTNPGEPPLFAGAPPYVEGPYKDWIRKLGEVQAIWTIAKTDGEAKVLYAQTDEAAGFTIIREGTEEKLKTCPDCSIDTYAYQGVDIGSTLQQKTQDALLKNPDANSMILPFDALVVGGVASALQASGRGQDIQVIGGEGDPATMDIIRAGGVGVQAGVGTPARWEGFSGADALLRLFAGEPVESSGIGLQVFDADHNLPAEGRYEPPIDFEAAYTKAWGVE